MYHHLFLKTTILEKYLHSYHKLGYLGYELTPVLYQQKKCISCINIVICKEHKCLNIL